MIGLVCHIPFVFFAGKESFLILIEETWNKTLSTHIEYGISKHEARESVISHEGRLSANLREVDEEKSIIETMNNWTYYIGTSILVTICILCATFIPDPS